MAQRQHHKGQKLSAEQITALEATPGWRWEDWSQTAWEVRLQQVQAFVRRHGRIPRQQGSKSLPLEPSERVLGTWCITQRERRKGSTPRQPLTAEQQAALATLPGWFTYGSDRWEQQRQQLEAFVRQHGRMPRKQATLKEPLLAGEQELFKWCKVQKQRQGATGRRSPLSARQLAAVEAIPLWCSKERL